MEQTRTSNPNRSILRVDGHDIYAASKLQPIVQLGTRTARAEHTTEFSDAAGNVLPTERVVRRLEATGALTEHTLESAARLSRLLLGRGLPTTILVNLSIRDLEQPMLTSRVTDVLSRHSLDGEAIGIEVTERLPARNVPAAAKTINDLRKLGCDVWADDVGTGFALPLLGALPFSGFKIAKEITQNVHHRMGRAIFIRLATLGGPELPVVAEGIEDHGTEAICAPHVNYLQGYHCARPMTPAAYLHWAAADAERHGVSCATSQVTNGT